MVALPSSSLISEIVESTHLQTLRLVKQGACHLEAYVNAYAVDPMPVVSKGTRYHALYYLSLVGMAGQSSTLEALFAHLTGSQWKGLHLDGVGEVILAHRSPRVESCGYKIHWQYEQAPVGESRHLHAIIESRQLTLRDPLLAYRSEPRRRSALGDAMREARRTKKKQQVSKTTAPNGKIKLSAEERLNQDLHPQFLLLIPGSQAENETALHQQHLAFLDLRVPWPLDPSWASFLWNRGLENKEILPLTTWCYTPSRPGARPFLAAAYYCQPNPIRLIQDIRQQLRAGHLSWRGMPSPSSSQAETPLTLLPAARHV